MYFSRSVIYFFPVCALRGHLNFLSMSAFIDTPNPIFILSRLLRVTSLLNLFLYCHVLTWQPATKLDGRSLTPPLPPSGAGRRNGQKGKLVG